MATTATHNSSKVSMEHNRREKKFIENELKKEEELKGTRHIDMDGDHANWIDRDIREVYEEEFGESVAAYNKGKKPSRQIKDYYQKICADEKKHPVYEMIVGVYGSDVPSGFDEKVVHDFVFGNEELGIPSWDERNPNLILIGAFWHKDEQNKLCGHGHLDYIPKGTQCTQGPKVGVSLTQALKEQSFEDKGRLTAQMQWQEREKQMLERICHEYGITTERAKEKVAHQEKEAYIATQENKKAQAELQQTQTELEALRRSISENQRTEQDTIKNIEELRKREHAASVRTDALEAAAQQRAETEAQLIQEHQEKMQQFQADIAYVSDFKQDIERLARNSKNVFPKVIKENPEQKSWTGKVKQPATTEVETEGFKKLQDQKPYTASDSWGLDHIEKKADQILKHMDGSKTKQYTDKIVELEQDLRREQQHTRKMSQAIDRFKDWVQDILQDELTRAGVPQSTIGRVDYRIQNMLDQLEQAAKAPELGQNKDSQEYEP